MKFTSTLLCIPWRKLGLMQLKHFQRARERMCATLSREKQKLNEFANIPHSSQRYWKYYQEVYICQQKYDIYSQKVWEPLLYMMILAVWDFSYGLNLNLHYVSKHTSIHTHKTFPRTSGLTGTNLHYWFNGDWLIALFWALSCSALKQTFSSCQRHC